MRKLGLRYRMMLSMLLIAAGCMAVISFANYTQSKTWREQNYIDLVDNKESLQVRRFDSIMQKMYLNTVRIRSSEQLRNCISDYVNGQQTYADGIQVSKTLKELLTFDDYDSALYLYIMESGQMFTSLEYYAVQEMDRTNTLIWNNQTGNPYAPLFFMNYFTDSADHVFGYSLPILDENGQKIAVICLTISERELYYDLVEPLNNNENGETYYLLAEDGIIYSAEDASKVGCSISGLSTKQNKRMTANTTADGMLQISVEGALTHCRLVCRSDLQMLTKELKESLYLEIAVISVVFLAMLMIVIHITGLMSQPIESFVLTMKRVEQGDFTARASMHEGDDEMNLVARGFNKLMDKIDGLMDGIVKERTEKREAEINALQYQIRPHFMYNTLNSIRFAAVLQRNQKLADLLSDFIELLEASIQRKGAFITLKEEMDLVKNFLSLQAFRYFDCFETIMHVETDAEKCYVPCLLLQPMVENAVFHGIDPKRNDNVLEIDAWIENDQLRISIRDNGEGFEAEDNEKRRLTGIGMNNVADRLKLYYGDLAYFVVDSHEGKGTTVEFCLPVSHDPDEYSISKGGQ